MDKLEELRKEIDILDTELLELIHKRLLVVEAIGRLKKELKIPPLSPARWAQVLDKGLKQAESLGMKKEFVKSILDTIHEEALQIEKQV